MFVQMTALRWINMKKNIEEALEEIKPLLQADGGNVELVDVDEEQGIVKVRLTGACAGCPYSQMTLKNGIEQILKQKVPGIKCVESV